MLLPSPASTMPSPLLEQTVTVSPRCRSPRTTRRSRGARTPSSAPLGCSLTLMTNMPMSPLSATTFLWIADFAGVEDDQPGLVGGDPIGGNRVPLDSGAGGPDEQQPAEQVVRQRKTAEAIVVCLSDEYARRKLPDPAALDRDSMVACRVVDPEIAHLLFGAAEHAVTVDRVAVQIELDVVRPDHDPATGAVDHIALQLRIARNRVAAANSITGGRCVRGRRERDPDNPDSHHEKKSSRGDGHDMERAAAAHCTLPCLGPEGLERP